ncbi:MAG: 3-oxoacyl-[acyl-carrier-protein] synthase-3 [Saprospiraceae bacterium]|jgi:3-oxoacyl-[acyl-carrier-protein] synthase-3
MAQFSIENVSVTGISAAVPKQIVSNHDYTLLSEKERRLLIKTTGVEEKRAAPKGLTTSDLCFEAANQLIDQLDWKKEEIGILIFVSQSSDYLLPATSIILQDRLGLPKSCMAFDIGLGCSGYVYGLSVMSAMMSASKIEKGLLLVGDVSSATCAIEDKSTYPLFGDAGTATALTYKDKSPHFYFNLQNDGSGFDKIIIKDGGIRNLITEKSLVKREISEGIVRTDLNVCLSGMDIFNFSVTEVPKSIKAFCEYIDRDLNEFDYIMLHQANKLMNETIRKKIKIPVEKVPYSIAKFGNTSSASIPLTIITELQNECRQSNIELLLSGFGVGLSWGVCNLQLDHIVCPDLIEI